MIALTKMLEAMKMISSNRGMDTSYYDETLKEIGAVAKRKHDTLVELLVAQGYIPREVVEHD